MKRSLTLVLLLLVACSTVTAPKAPPVPVHLVIVGTTDVHGWFAGHTDNPAVKGRDAMHYGGLAILSSYVQALRATNGDHLLLLDSGDLFQGTLESNLFEGDAVVKGYNALGYTAAAVGNHEFDYGPIGPAAVAGPGQDPLGALKKNAADAHFTFLSANMTEKATGQTPSWAKPFRMVEVGGVKLGIIGLSTPDTPNVTMPANVVTLDFGDPIAATERAAAELRKQGADAIVVIAHMGGRCNDMADVQDVASCDVNQESMHFLQELPAGTIDAYFGGHTHSQMRQYVHGVPAVQALPYSREFATLDLWVDTQTHHVAKSEIRPHTMLCTAVYSGTEQCDPRQMKADSTLVPRTFEGHPIGIDPTLMAMFAPYLEKTAQKRNEPLGVRATGAFTRGYLKESSLGDLLTDLMRQSLGTDVAFLNSGGIRADIPPRDLVYANIFEVSPFDNYPSIVMLTGAQLADCINLTSTGDRGILQTSGLRYTADVAKGLPNHLVTVTLADGTPLDPQKLYRVAMPDFLAAGGDGLMPVMKSVPAGEIQTDLSQPLRELFVTALKKRAGTSEPLTPKVDGRITILNAPSGAEH
jgi:5'-nucleotidase